MHQLCISFQGCQQCPCLIIRRQEHLSREQQWLPLACSSSFLLFPRRRPSKRPCMEGAMHHDRILARKHQDQQLPRAAQDLTAMSKQTRRAWSRWSPAALHCMQASSRMVGCHRVERSSSLTDW